MEKKYKSLDTKIKKLVRNKIGKPNINAQFYPRVINKTNISFSDDELTPLNKGLKYVYNLKIQALTTLDHPQFALLCYVSPYCV